MILGIIDEVGYSVNRCVVCGKLFKTESLIDKVCSEECYEKGGFSLIKEDTRFHKTSLVLTCQVYDSNISANRHAWYLKNCSDNYTRIATRARKHDVISI